MKARLARFLLGLLVREPWAACADCGLPYSDDGFQDLVVENEAWAVIAPRPDGGGLLCPTCLVRRLVRVGFDRVSGSFRSGPLATP